MTKLLTWGQPMVSANRISNDKTLNWIMKLIQTNTNTSKCKNNSDCSLHMTYFRCLREKANSKHFYALFAQTNITYFHLQWDVSVCSLGNIILWYSLHLQSEQIWLTPIENYALLAYIHLSWLSILRLFSLVHCNCLLLRHKYKRFCLQRID